MPEESTPRRERKRTVQQMVVVGVIATAIGIAIGLTIHWFPPADSTQADKIDTLWDVLVIATVPVFVLVTVIIGFAVIEFRMRPGEENLDGPPIHGNTRLEVIWTTVPAILIIGLVTYAYVVMRDIEKAPAAGNERVVTVTGQQFTWSFAYNEGGKKFTTAQLYLPAGKSVKFDVKSKDVIHDFWVPDFRVKIDAVPGITTHYRVTPKNPAAIGDHAIVCAELCGLGHAFMRQTAHILAPADFDKWVQKMTTPRRSTPSSSSPTATPTPAPRPAPPATRWPMPAPRARSAPTSTRSSRARTRPSSSSRSSTPTRSSRPDTRPGSCPRTSAIRCRPSRWMPWSSTSPR
jgi:cytochrome c oxidase subunit 2